MAVPAQQDSPVRQWVLSLPIPLRVLLAAQPELVSKRGLEAALTQPG
jgi:hypothetical protein